jgi:OHCU decarboxylase
VAFAAHPRIGERGGPAHASGRAAAWSASEQGVAQQAATETMTAMARANAAYEERFGYRFLVFANGRSAESLLADCTARLTNAPDDELRVAAEQQRRITRLRLVRLLEEPS